MPRSRYPMAKLPRGTSRQSIYRKLRAANMKHCPTLLPGLPCEDSVNLDDKNSGKH